MSKPLIIVSPLAITEAMVTDTDVPEADYADYAAATAYSAGDRVVADHRIFEAVQSSTSDSCTISNASPGVVLLGNRSDLLVADLPVRLSTDGALPSPLVAGTVYYAQPYTPQHFWLSATPGGAQINTTTAGSGNHYCELAVNVGFDPTDADNIGTHWLEVSPTNRWGILDGRSSSVTAQADEFFYEFELGVSVDSVYVGNVQGCTSMHVTVTDDDYGLAYDETVDFTAAPYEASWWHWYFGTRRAPRSHVLTGLPALPNAVIRIEFVGTADLAVGVLVFGQSTRFGVGVTTGSSVGIQDYSRRERNDFGDLTLVTRAYADLARLRVVLRNEEVDALRNYLAALRTTPAVFVSHSTLQSLVVYGIYKSFDIVISYERTAECELELEGLT